MLSKNKIEEIIRGSMDRVKQQKKEFIMFNRVFIRLLQPTMIPFVEVIDRIEKTIPGYLFDEVDEIFVGSFNENDSRALEAHYESGAIYVTNDMPTVMDYVENIVHETAHSMEQSMGLLIYGDKKIETEFLGKRDALKRALGANSFDTSDVDFSNAEYSEIFDLYLYKEVGYEKIKPLINGLFMSPYSITSLEEYFTSGLEDYFLGKSLLLKTITPALYNKMEIYDVLD